MTFAPGAAISQQSIGVANPDSGDLEGFHPFDGILGQAPSSVCLCTCVKTPVTVRSIGPKGLSVGTLNPDNTSVIPTVTDNLFEQGKISQNLVALSFQPMDSAPIKNGEMTFGDTDPSKYTGEINYLYVSQQDDGWDFRTHLGLHSPITKTNPAEKYWAVDASFRYGGDSVILNPTAGVIDAITNLILIPTGKLICNSDSYQICVLQTHILGVRRL